MTRFAGKAVAVTSLIVLGLGLGAIAAVVAGILTGWIRIGQR